MRFKRFRKRKKQHGKLSSSTPLVEKGRIFIPLGEFENSWAILLEKGITTINFFCASEEDIDYNVSVQKLKARLKLICEANPWLVGKIVRDKQKHKRLLCVYPEEISDSDIDAIFATNLDGMENISSSTPYPEIATTMTKAGAILPSGYQLINKDVRVAKVCLLSIAQGREYVLCVSLAHVVGDGFTYYKLMSMIPDATNIESLQVERVDRSEATVAQSVGSEEQRFIHSPWIMVNAIAKWVFSSPTHVYSCFVDKDKIAKAKAEAKLRHPGDSAFYVSTNDVISSSFGKESDADCLLMACNLRGRCQEFSESFAGNYETILYYDKESFHTPDSIRKSLHHGPPYKRISGKPIPSRSTQMRMAISFITSWAFSTFDADLHLWDSKGVSSRPVKLHLPVYNAKDNPPIPFGIVYKPCKGKLAVMCFCPAKNNFFEKTTRDLLGNSVSKDIFVNS